MHVNNIVAILNTIIPVSYTHLDVYKRQVIYCINSKVRPVLGISRKAIFNSISSAFDKKPCLLYTSRKEQCTITTHKNLSVKVDYISIVFDTATAEDVIMHILGLPTDIFNVYPASFKFKTYQARWQIGDIYVSGDEMCIRDSYYSTKTGDKISPVLRYVRIK